MKIVIFSVLLIGTLLNAMITGFTSLALIYLIIAALLLVFCILRSKKLKASQTIAFLIITTIFLIVGIFFPVSSDIASYYKELKQSANLIDKGNYSKARDILDDLVIEHPNDPDINQDLAVIYMGRGLLLEAKNHLDTASRNKPADHSLHYNYGLIFFAEKDYERALKHFESAILLEPELRYAYTYAGISSLNLRELRKALYYLENAVKSFPPGPEVMFYLGRTHMELFEYTEAMLFFRRALELSPKSDLEGLINLNIQRIPESWGVN